jgi:hypothetical protein
MQPSLLPGVPAYPRNDAAGGGAILALAAALKPLGFTAGYPDLLVLSGAAFTFVYDNATVFEPLRDLTPLDTVRIGTRAAGLNGRWVTDRPASEVLEQVADGLAAGRPAFLPIYSVEGIHGFGIAVGCAPSERRVWVQRGERDYVPAMAPTVLELTLPDVWWGAVTGPQAWAACPAFLIDRGAPTGWNAEGRLVRALVRGAAMIAGGHTPYHDCEGVREYAGVPLAGRQAAYGLPAYDLLAADIGSAEWLGGFDLIWRLDAQLAQLQHHRAEAGRFFATVAHPLATEATTLCRSMAEAAGDLAARFWFHPSKALKTATDVLSAVGSQSAMIFPLGLGDEERGLLSRRIPVVQTPWGHAAVVDTVPRRKAAAALVESLRQQDERLGQVLSRLADAL